MELTINLSVNGSLVKRLDSLQRSLVHVVAEVLTVNTHTHAGQDWSAFDRYTDT